MKFNVEKFNNLTNNSNYYRDWDNELLQMFDVLDCLPTYTDKKHYLIYEIRRFTYLHIGFDDDGNIFTEIHHRKYKDVNKPLLNEQQITKMNELILQKISVFDSFGYIVHSKDNYEVKT